MENGDMKKIFILTIIREFLCLIIVFSLLILRNDSNDMVTVLCGLIKLFILLWNGAYIIKYIKKNSAETSSIGLWMVCCVVDACFSLQILISVLFHFQNSIEKSIILLNIYVMVYVSFDTMISLLLLLVIVIDLKRILNENKVIPRKAKHINIPQIRKYNTATKSTKLKDECENQFSKTFEPGK